MNMFQILTIMSFFMLLPVTLLFEGFQLCPAAWSSMGMNEAAQQVLMQRLLLAGVCFHGYQQLSYMILGQVTPVTHSIGNCVKRVVVIVASVVAFSHPMSTQNAIGEWRTHGDDWIGAGPCTLQCIVLWWCHEPRIWQAEAPLHAHGIDRHLCHVVLRMLSVMKERHADSCFCVYLKCMPTRNNMVAGGQSALCLGRNA